MSNRRKTIGLLEVMGYLIGGVMLLPAVSALAGNAKAGVPLYLVAGLAVIGLGIILGSITFLGQRRILPVGVTRDGEAIVCRYIPWYELNNYTMFAVMPAMSLALIGAGFAPGRPRWVALVGILVAGVVPLAGYFVVQMWRRCLLKLSSAAITVRLPTRGSQPVEIPRSRIESITSADAEVGAAFAPVTVSQIAITFQSADRSNSTQTVLVGPPPGKATLQVSAQPTNLYYALQAWKDGDPANPSLLERVEAILRGQPPTRV